MLLEFKCSNHRSIKDEVLFSMIASPDNTKENLLMEYSKYRILPSAVIYGANGSGKTNFLDALSYMKYLVLNSITFQPGQVLLQFPHKLADRTLPSTYSIQYVKNGIRYAYGFSVKENIIDEEYLYYFPNNRKVKIFVRDLEAIEDGSKFVNKFSTAKDVLKENRLFLSCIANFSTVAEAEEAFKFFSEDLVIYNRPEINWMRYSLNLLQKDQHIKKIFLKIMDDLGTGIKNVEAKVELFHLDDMGECEQIPEQVQLQARDQNSNIVNRVEAKVMYQDFTVDLLSEESTGIKRLFEMICPIIDIIQKGRVLVCDEFESGLHEALVYRIVELFQSSKNESSAQLIFSTHDTSLLDRDLFRRDQIWFTQLDKKRATDLYSLIEIKNVRKFENLSKGYIAGKYGAIPMLRNDLIVEDVD